ncbi:hypothetical protein FQN54_002110 [Arachnomyces sp. PD_36]|nr:hypothetical protein FQN54_002110 [Arachnomyces sp. PD_36]
MAAFGWSVGDIIQGIRVVSSVCQAFSSTKGAEAHFADTISFLRGLRATLEAIEQHVSDADGNMKGKYSAHVLGILETIEPPFKKFAEYVEGYRPALEVSSRKSTIRKAGKKTKWAVEHLDKLSGKTAELKDAIASPLSLIMPLLILQAIDDIRSIAPPNVQQPLLNGGIIHFCHQSDVVPRLLSTVEDLKTSMVIHEKSLLSQIDSVKTLLKTLQPGNLSIKGLASSKSTQGDGSRLPNEDIRMVMAIEMLRLELKQATEAVLELLEDSRRSSFDDESVVDELELYRRAFKGIQQSLENSWLSLREIESFLERNGSSGNGASTEVTREEPYTNRPEARAGYGFGNSASLGVTAIASFFGSAMATVASGLFTRSQTCNENSSSPHQFSSDFAGLTYAHGSASSPASRSDESSAPQNTSGSSDSSKAGRSTKNENRPCQSSGGSPIPVTSTTKAQGILSQKRIGTSRSKYKNSPEPTPTFDSALGALYNGAAADLVRPSASNSTRAAGSTHQREPAHQATQGYSSHTRSSVLDSTNSTSSVSASGNFSIPSWESSTLGASYNGTGTTRNHTSAASKTTASTTKTRQSEPAHQAELEYSRSRPTYLKSTNSTMLPQGPPRRGTQGESGSLTFYCCCQCHHVSIMPAALGDNCYMCGHVIDYNCQLQTEQYMEAS